MLIVATLILLLFGCFSAVLAVSDTARTTVISKLTNWAKAYGYQGLTENSPFTGIVENAPSVLRNIFSTAQIPHLIIDIEFKHFQQLAKQRTTALNDGALIQGNNSFVPAKLRVDGKTVKAKLRLKGDLLDHLDHENKWSFRINVKGNDQVFGLRKFSIQHPKTRCYQGEGLFLETLKYLGVLAPKYFFVNVTVNGNDIGIMALEEHFSKELLEAQGRRESVIVKFDESLLWEANAPRRLDSPFYSYRNTRIAAFGYKKILESKKLTEDYAAAVGLMRAFAYEKLPPSEVFDIDIMGRFLAAADFWGAYHATNWRNIRFYFNPVTTKLEPIGYDSSLLDRYAVGYRISRLMPMNALLLKDFKIFSAYAESLLKLSRTVQSGELLTVFETYEKESLKILKNEFFFAQNFPRDELLKRGRFALKMAQQPFRGAVKTMNYWDKGGQRNIAPIVKDPQYYPTLLHANLINGERGHKYLEISNAVPDLVIIDKVEGILLSGEVLPVTLKKNDYPVDVPPTPSKAIPRLYAVDYSLPLSDIDEEVSLVLTAHVKGHDRAYRIKAENYHPPLKTSPVPRSTLQKQLRQHSFLRQDSDSDKVYIEPGFWDVDGSLVIPAGITLVVSGGTTLSFDRDHGLISHGPLRFVGENSSPIILGGKQNEKGIASWQGVAVLEAGAKSRWSHVKIQNTTGVTRTGWTLTGGVTFYRSDIHMDNCVLSGNRSEDALNVVHSTFSLKNVEFYNTTSDAFDSDFSQGSVLGGRYHTIGKAGGGDGIDISGSTVNVANVNFEDISDKALSVGEKSNMTVTEIIVNNAGAGAVSKDGSTLSIADSSFTNIKVASLMAYIKKKEYGSAEINATGLELGENSQIIKTQKKSRIVIDGINQKREKFDVEKLYETTMKSRFRQ